MKLFLLDAKQNSELKFPFAVDEDLCDICGELVPSTKSQHCMRNEESIFQRKQFPIVGPVSLRRLGKFYHRLETELSDVHPTHSLCPYCNVVYEQNELSDHISEHSNLPYLCDRCGSFFSYEKELGEHEKEHGDTVLCMNCFKVCDDAVDLITHKTVRALPLECVHCKEMFTSHCAMHSHRATCSPKKKIYNNVNNQKVKCSQCTMVFATQQRLEDHFRQHTGERPFSCEYCFQTYSRKDNLNRHLRKNRIEDGFTCECSICHLRFSSKCALRKHYSEKHPEQSVDQFMKVACVPEQSEQIIVNGRSLRSRIQSSEPNSVSSPSQTQATEVAVPVEMNDAEPVGFSCEQCSKTFGCRKSLTNHLRTLHSQDNLPHACHLCSRTFAETILLNRHLNWHKGAQYQCRDCGICYSHSKHLQRHMKKVHSVKKNMSRFQTFTELNVKSTPDMIKLEAPSQEYTSVGGLNSEILSPVDLTQTDSNAISNAADASSAMKSFLTYAELLVLVENKQKPYVCQECGKLTDSKRNYLEHYLSHSKERPFKCDVCGQGFIRERRMLDHKVIHERVCKKTRLEEECNENTHFQSSSPDRKPLKRLRLDTSKSSENTCLRLRLDDSPYIAKFSHLFFKTPSIRLNRFDLYPPTSEGLVQSSCSMVHFRCEHCNRLYSRRSALVSHQRSCAFDVQPSTEIPRARRSKPFKYLHSFEKENKIVVYGMEHTVSTVNGVHHFTCGVCGRSFDKKNFIFKHTLIHVKDKPFKCALCLNRGFMTRNSLKKHFRKCHKDLTIDKEGNVVQKTGTTPTAPVVWNEPPIPNNAQISLLADRLTQGYAENDISKSPEHITVECDLNDMMNMFDSEIILEKEERMETQTFPISAPVSTFVQPSYPVHTVFITQPTGLRHLPMDVEMPFVDSYPNYHLNDVTMNHFLESTDVEMEDIQFARKSSGSVVAPEEVFLTCGQCNMSFETKEEMFKHYVAHDMANDPIKCAICDKEFVRRQYLQMHAMMHARPKKFQCTFCTKSFRAKRDMDDHIRTHTGEKPFACEHCDRKFRVRKQLYAHRKLHVQAFQCAKCSASFSIEWSLKRHERLCLRANLSTQLLEDEIIIKEENDVIKQEPIFHEAIVPELSVTESRKTEMLRCTEDSSLS